jgi:lipoprotein-anchoring transpeptidase ErfK/SrfK
MAVSLLGASVPRVKRARPQFSAEDFRVQVLLDRAHFSPGEIDGTNGNVTRRAIRAFQEQHQLPPSGNADDATRKALEAGQESTPTLVTYTITDDDVRGPFTPVPDDMMEKAKLPELNYASPLEALCEKFHSSPKLLERLNPGKDFSKAGEQMQVPNVHQDFPAKAAQVVVSKSKQTVQALDGGGKVIAEYPATMGSKHDPLPIGEWKVTHVTRDPVFYYNPDLFWDAPGAHTKAKIKRGPNNPVGVVWIGLTKEHYGLHGTPEPSMIGRIQSHGCVRLTNWDASELGQMVDAGTPVIFKE